MPRECREALELGCHTTTRIRRLLSADGWQLIDGQHHWQRMLPLEDIVISGLRLNALRRQGAN